MQHAFLMSVLMSTVTISAKAQDANKPDPTTRLWFEVNTNFAAKLRKGR